MASSRTITVFNADSLGGLMRDLSQRFEAAHPSTRVLPEGSGSLDAVRKVTDLHLPCDVLVTADWRLLAKPHHGVAPWVAIFAGNSIGILYTRHSRDSGQINAGNWYRVMLRKGVRYGHSDPERDPAGYWTLLMWKLAARYYHRPNLFRKLVAHCPPANIRPHNVYLIALLQSGELDYYFGYASDALLGNLKFLALPDAINLGDFAKSDQYRAVSAEVGSGARRHRVQGAAIAFGATMTANPVNRAGAIDFLKLMLGATGRAMVARNGLIAYPRCFAVDPNHTMPPELRSLCRPLPR